LISGRDWFDSEFLVEAYRKCFAEALKDEEFGMWPFEDRFKVLIIREVKKWTWIQWEQENLVNDMLEKAAEDKINRKPFL
jgi:hypothetical protein